MTHAATVLRDTSGDTFFPNFHEANIAFTFAAGFLFQHLSINEPFRSFIARRCRNVIVPYVLISIPAILLYTVVGKSHPHVDLSVIPDFLLPLYLLLTGLHLGPLWFVPMIFTIYLSTPAIRWVDRSPWLYTASIAASLLLALTVFPRPEHNQNPILAGLHYLPIFLIGMAFSRYNDRIEPRCRQPHVWIPAAMLFLALGYVTRDYPSQMQYAVKIVMLVCVYVVACRTSTWRSAAIDVLAKCSFGIFFLHGYIIAALRILQARGDFDAPQTWPNLLSVTALVCLACVAIIYTTKLLFGKRSRLLVGA